MKLDRDRRSQISRESMKGARGLMRCPACLMVQECTLKGFTCRLTRCPAHVSQYRSARRAAAGRARRELTSATVSRTHLQTHSIVGK